MMYGIKIRYKVIPTAKYTEYTKGFFKPIEHERTRYFETIDKCMAYKLFFLDGNKGIIREEIDYAVFSQMQLDAFTLESS